MSRRKYASPAELLRSLGLNVELAANDWGTLINRRAVKEPPDHGGWHIFYTYLGGFGNISPGPNIAIRGTGTKAWFGWPTDEEMEALRDAWFEAPDLGAQQKICSDMQVRFWQNPSYVPLGMYDQPTAFRTTMKDIPDGWPQFYSLRKEA